MSKKTEIPDTTKGSALVEVKGVTYAIYFVDGKQRRKSLGTVSGKAAEKARDAVFEKLVFEGATIKQKKTATEKVADDPDRYIQKELPYKFIYKGKVLGRFETKKAAKDFRDSYLERANAERIHGDAGAGKPRETLPPLDGASC